MGTYGSAEMGTRCLLYTSRRCLVSVPEMGACEVLEMSPCEDLEMGAYTSRFGHAHKYIHTRA